MPSIFRADYERSRSSEISRKERLEEEEMKMKRVGLMEEGKESEGGYGRTVVVGIEMDAFSRELLTWALVKVAEPGDRVVALHVLSRTELLDKEGKSSLLSLVKAFESILSVYEGFCNLKQIDLKLKICRGSLVRRVLVQEAKSISADILVVGLSRKSCRIGFSASVAKYCARNLPLECWVLAVSNGKVEFQRKSTAAYSLSGSIDGADLCILPNNSVSELCRSKNSKVFNGRTLKQQLLMGETTGKNEGCRNHKDLRSDYPRSSTDKTLLRSSYKTCSICEPDLSWEASSEEQNPSAPDRSKEEAGVESLSWFPTDISETASTSNSALDLPETRPGWPLLHKTITNSLQGKERSMVREISVVEWVLQLPTRHPILEVCANYEPANSEATNEKTITDSHQNRTNLGVENRAIVGTGNATSAPSENSDLNISEKELEYLHKKYSSSCRLFSYQELKSATCNFSLEKLIAKGGNSQVYKGHLADGKELAVKILKSSEDAKKEFCLEIEILSTLQHNNIISLLGFCFEENKHILVYDFVSKGSLEQNLHGRKDDIILNWGKRYKVAVGVAGALDYLHSGAAQPVIHRDVKSSNILLTNDFEPQLSDFGLAIWESMNSAQIACGDVAGTFGYLAPEYFMYGKVSDKIDVYAFGIVLLELLSGRKPINNEYPKGQESLVMWAKPILQSGKFKQLLDPNLGDDYDKDQFEKMVLAASLCIRRTPRLRPHMSLIMKLLQGDDAMIKRARLQVTASEDFDVLNDEASPASHIQSYLNLAFLDVEDDSLSVSSIEHSVKFLTLHKSLDDYLQERSSRSSSFH